MNKKLNIIQKRNASADWLNTFSWDWYAILTFKQEVGVKQAYKIFNKWKLELKHTVQHPIQYFMIIETPRLKVEHLHIHLLLTGTRNEKPNEWERKWFGIAGIGKIQLYDHNMGARYYLGEKLARGDNEIMCSKDLRFFPSFSFEDSTKLYRSTLNGN